MSEPKSNFHLDKTVSADIVWIGLPSLVQWLEDYAQVLESRPAIPPAAAAVVRNAMAELLLHDLRTERP